MKKFQTLILSFSVAVLLTACEKSPSQPDSGTTDKIINAHETPEDWLNTGGDYNEQRHTLLTGINKDNLAKLSPAWTYDLRTHRGVEATPLIVDGVMYLTGPWSVVYALDAKSGREIWTYDPNVPGEAGANGCCDVVNRGVAVYDGKIFVGTFDGRLQALDSRTGELLWSKTTIDQNKPYTITSSPRAAKGKVFIGNSGAKSGVRGYISAYDTNTGDLVWRFFTTPNPDKKPDGAASDDIIQKIANKSWGKNGVWKTSGGGGTVQDSIVYDHIHDSIIFATSGGAPQNAMLRDQEGDGDNLFLDSIIAVDANTGSYRWHYQENPRTDRSDTANQTIVLADLPLGDKGGKRRVVMHASGDGFFYVVDAKTGTLISREKYIEAAKPQRSNKGDISIPGLTGNYSRQPIAFNPHTKLAYIPAQRIAFFLGDQKTEIKKKSPGITGGHTSYRLTDKVPVRYRNDRIEKMRKFNKGYLIAWDPVKQKAAWKLRLDTRSHGGVLSTESGLIFQGDIKGILRAYDARNGDELWTSDIKIGLLASPSTYEIDGEQYIVIAAGWGGLYTLAFGMDMENPAPPVVGRVIAFKLGGKGFIPELPDPVAPEVDPKPKARTFGSKAMITKGARQYHEACWRCHGVMAISSGVLPDLRWSSVSADPKMWKDIVIGGILKDNGMVSYNDTISAKDAEAIRAYVIDQGHLAIRHQNQARN